MLSINKFEIVTSGLMAYYGMNHYFITGCGDSYVLTVEGIDQGGGVVRISEECYSSLAAVIAEIEKMEI